MRRVDAAPCGARCHSRNTTLASRAFLSRREGERREREEERAAWSNVRRTGVPFDAAALDRATDLVIHADHANVSRFRLGSVPLPSAAHVRAAMLSLRQASCAVVGAAPSLGRCAARHTVCSHDVVIRVNDHPPLDGCRRTDIAVQNQFACVPAINASLAPLAATDADAPFVDERGVVRETRGGAADRKRWPSSLKRQPCRTRLPRLFRLRTEWVAPLAAGRARAPCVSHRWADINCKPRSAEYHTADGSWLSSGVASRAAHAEVKRRRQPGEPSAAASAGGVAVAFALAACRSVHLYGLGGGSLNVTGNASRRAAIASWLHHREMNRYKFSHNLAAERRWLEALVEQRRATPVCF